MKDLTFTQLRTFACVASSGSFARAADELNISQPAVSEQIRTLEERLDCHLLERRRGTTPTLTRKGEAALGMIEAILAANGSLFQLGLDPADKVIVRIAIGPYLRDNYLSPLMPRIHRELPHVEIELRAMVHIAEALRLFERRELDLALCGTSHGGASLAHGRHIFDLPLILVAKPGTEALLKTGNRSLNDFQYIFPIRRDMGGERWAKGRLRDLGITPSVPPVFIELTREIAQMVEEGQGIGYLMSHSVSDRISTGRLEVLDIPLAPMRRVIARSHHASEDARIVEQMILETLSI